MLKSGANVLTFMINVDKDFLRSVIIDAAHAELLPRFTHVESYQKEDGSWLTEVDIALQQRIVEALQDQYPESVVLGEEMPEHEQLQCLQSGKPVWCLDPVDGTSNLVSGIPYFSISLALIEHGNIEVAFVYDPMRDEMFTTQRGQGARLNGKPLLVKDSNLTLKQSIALIDFKRLDPDLAIRLVSESPYASQRSFGSVALDWCWLAAGRVQVYLHGGANLWDYVAGHAIFSEAGGFSMTLEGEHIFTPTLTKRSMLAATDQKLFTEWMQALKVR